MTSKQLVPSRELCQEMNKLGWKKFTAFVWLRKDAKWWVAGIDDTRFDVRDEAIFAPTLQELLEELRYYIFTPGFVAFGLTQEVLLKNILIADNPANAAAELYCEIHKPTAHVSIPPP